MLTTLQPCTRSIHRYLCRSCLSTSRYHPQTSIRNYSNQKTLKISGRRIPSKRGHRVRKIGENVVGGGKSTFNRRDYVELRQELKAGQMTGDTQVKTKDSRKIDLESGDVASKSNGHWKAFKASPSKKTQASNENESGLPDSQSRPKKTAQAAATPELKGVSTEPSDGLRQKGRLKRHQRRQEERKNNSSPAAAPKIDGNQSIKDLEACDGLKKNARRNAIISKAPLEGLVALMQSGKLNEKEEALADMFMKVRMSVNKYASKPKEDALESSTPGKEESRGTSDGKEKPSIEVGKKKSLEVEEQTFTIRHHDAKPLPHLYKAREKHQKHIQRTENVARLSKLVVSKVPGKSKARKAQPRPVLRKVSVDRGEVVEEREIRANDLVLVPLEKKQPPVPALAYGLDRVLFNPGVYNLRDPRSKVFNFDPYLDSIMPVSEFDFNALKEYITSSRDEVLISSAREQNMKYTGSTSSMTTALAHFHFLLSQWRPINTSGLSRMIDTSLQTFTGLQRAPSAVFLRWKNGVYAIDADKEFDTANILMNLGKSMEKLLTLPTEEFEKYRKINSHQISEEERNEPEAFHYTTMGDFLMRSQLDAYDPRLPGSGMFDLKTRAVVSIRMDARNYQDTRHYEIKTAKGDYESYEREFYDMIRAAFLKYSLQVRMGRMDGIFVAFHNTQRIFGFQYISLPEMDFTLHGTEDTTIGNAEFKLSIDLLNKVLDRATAEFPEQSLRLFFETSGEKAGAEAGQMYVYAEPVTDEQIEAIQQTNRAEVDAFQRKLLGLDKDEESLTDSQDEKSDDLEGETELAENVADEDSANSVASQDDDGELTDDNVTAAIDADDVEAGKVVDDAEVKTTEVEVKEEPHQTPADSDSDSSMDEYLAELQREFNESNPKDSEGTADTIKDEEPPSPLDEYMAELQRNFKPEQPEEPKPAGPPPLIAMNLTIKNIVNGKPVLRPDRLTQKDEWTVEYTIKENTNMDRAWTMYGACQNRRRRALEVSKSTNKAYVEMLKKLSRRGQKFREEQDRLDRENGIKVYGVEDWKDEWKRDDNEVD